ncbi:hypothetical protein LJ737_20450 [Hymenobacter sp. 15J16-1T3B]|uniref:MutS-related protein n=1 Tax=Hymenobacter sp. 15J16-1T3B TaxID=2886941 RepID=UPI001D11C518|nr:hypothetical protein [Hymenobacter sp. 15J16-1T3B]MCC3159624.1 hypothetical protein [Hymenobacter sp. 15J16-1T3B]
MLFGRPQPFRTTLRAAWGQPKAGHRNFALIARYHRIVAEAEPAAPPLDEATWQDLNLDEVFTALDHTQSRVGQQVLYHRLRTPRQEAAEVAGFQASVAALAADAPAREAAQLALHRLAHYDAYHLADLFAPAPPVVPGWTRAAPWLALVSAGLLLASAVEPALLFGVGLVFIVNLLLHYRGQYTINAQLKSLEQLGNLYRAGRALAAVALPGLDAAALRTDLAALRPLVGRLGFVAQWSQVPTVELLMPVWLLGQYVKITFLLDLLLFRRNAAVLQARKAPLRRLYEALGYVDSALAVASWQQTVPYHCAPDFGARPQQLELREVYHPLVPGCVPNSLAVDGRSVLLTGSNMSGKTTFMRTVGVNVVLAQAVGCSLARAYRAPLLRVRSSIAVADSLTEGKSYYYQEVEAVRALVQAADAPGQLFILDELFKGTNTVERIAVAYAVLQHLGRHATVLAATHDGELAPLLRSRYDLYHFTEAVAAHDLVFDFKLKPGPLTTRNAIRVLALAGYPPDVVAAAQATAARLDQQQAARPPLTPA